MEADTSRPVLRDRVCERERCDLFIDFDRNLLLFSPGGSGASKRLSDAPRCMTGFLVFVGVSCRDVGRPRVGVFLRMSLGLSPFKGETAVGVLFSGKFVPDKESRSPPRRRGRIGTFPTGFSMVFGLLPSPAWLPRRTREGVFWFAIGSISFSNKCRVVSPTLRLRRVGVVGLAALENMLSSVSWLAFESLALDRLRPLDTGLTGSEAFGSCTTICASPLCSCGMGDNDPEIFLVGRSRGGDWETTFPLPEWGSPISSRRRSRGGVLEASRRSRENGENDRSRGGCVPVKEEGA